MDAAIRRPARLKCSVNQFGRMYSHHGHSRIDGESVGEIIADS